MTLSTALVARDPWSVVPSLGNLDAYIRAVQAIPMLEADEEQQLARRLRDQQDVQAPLVWCFLTCAWWCPSRASTWVMACPKAT